MTVLAFDVGGTRIKAALVSNGRAGPVTVAPTGDSDAAGALVEQLRDVGKTITAGHAVEAVAVSARGIVDPRSGVFVDVNPPLSCLAGEALGPLLEAAFSVPAYVENDGRMHALGELRHGAARGETDVVSVTLGTGVGTGVAIGGRVLRGRRGTGGILGGHFTVDAGGRRCSCGNVGCLNALVGAAALDLEPAAVFAAATDGDPIAAAARDRFVTHLGAGLVTLIHAYDPDLVVVGGGLSRSAAAFMPAVRQHVDAHAWTHPRARVRVVVSELGDRAALLGAAELVSGDGWAW